MIDEMQLDFNHPPYISLCAAGMAMILLFAAPACRSASPPSGDVITVSGEVTVRGNEPFAAYVLETADRNFYVLEMDPETARAISTPSHAEITGEVYLAEWNGRPFAHLRVIDVTTH